MRQKSSNGNSQNSSEKRAGPQGSQTLLRGLDMLDQVVDGPIPLAELSQRMGSTRSTTHRLANALIDHLSTAPSSTAAVAQAATN